jgi:peptide deformylase
MILEVVCYGDPILRRKADPVLEITQELRDLTYNMVETMDAKNGIGISAPQIGRSIRLFVLRNYQETKEGELGLSDPIVYINPKIISVSRETCSETEGCLSIPGIREKVERPISIVLEALDLDGNLFKEEISGYNARVRLHENDHLNGVLFIDRLGSFRRKKIDSMLKQIAVKCKKNH